MELPTYPRPPLITDACLNVQPDLLAKRDIVQNAIDLALAIGLSEPKGRRTGGHRRRPGSRKRQHARQAVALPVGAGT